MIKWRDIVTNNPAWLAKMAGATKYDKSADQNIKIANRLRKNEVEPFYDYKENAKEITDFDEVQKILINKNLWDKMTMDLYITNLTVAQIEKLNTLSSLQKAMFIGEECVKVNVTQ
ncbi:MAG: hypothetical protein WCP92_04490 [bacterium]